MKETIQFESIDGLLIAADTYFIENSKNLILLCHQARFNRGEYQDTAPKLNKLGYSCLAIDQRAGREAQGTLNQTHELAIEKGLPTDYLDAKPDIEAAIGRVYKQNNDKPIILVGSSYSASLSLLIGSENNEKVGAIIAFSPGEYLNGIVLTDAIQEISVPTLVLSSKSESFELEKLISKADKSLVDQFKPQVEGIHGSRALWSETEGNEEYWARLQDFLEKLD